MKGEEGMLHRSGFLLFSRRTHRKIFGLCLNTGKKDYWESRRDMAGHHSSWCQPVGKVMLTGCRGLTLASS